MLKINSVFLKLDSWNEFFDGIGIDLPDNTTIRIKGQQYSHFIDVFVEGYEFVPGGVFGKNTRRKVRILHSLEGYAETDFDLTLTLKQFVETLKKEADEAKRFYGVEHIDEVRIYYDQIPDNVFVQSIVVERKVVGDQKIVLNTDGRCRVVLD